MGTPKYDEPGSLLTRTKQLLAADYRDILTIHKETGLPFYWLKDLRSGKIKAPSVNRVQALYEYYTKRPLSIA